MVRRVCKALGHKKNIIVINDEAHHCYRRRVGDDDPSSKGMTEKRLRNGMTRLDAGFLALKRLRTKSVSRLFMTCLLRPSSQRFWLS
jgi:hypothetical protein